MKNISQRETSFNLLTQVVRLQRAGSGDCVVVAPSDNWVNIVKSIHGGKGKSYEPYAEMRVAVVPNDEKGYGNKRGCTLIFLPGNDASVSQFGNDLVELRGVPRTEEILESPTRGTFGDSQRMFSISTNFDDIKLLHEAIGHAISAIENEGQK